MKLTNENNDQNNRFCLINCLPVDNRRIESSESIYLSFCVMPAPEHVYQSERWSENRFAYLIPNLFTGVKQLERLHFPELVYMQLEPRTFDVLLNGNKILEDFYKVDAAGAHFRSVIKKLVVQQVV